MVSTWGERSEKVESAMEILVMGLGVFGEGVRVRKSERAGPNIEALRKVGREMRCVMIMS